MLFWVVIDMMMLFVWLCSSVLCSMFDNVFCRLIVLLLIYVCGVLFVNVMVMLCLLVSGIVWFSIFFVSVMRLIGCSGMVLV